MSSISLGSILGLLAAGPLLAHAHPDQQHFSAPHCVIPHGESLEEHLEVPSPPLDIESLILSGPAENRVNLVFFSDGYLPGEQAKFLEDARFLADDVTGNHTFNTVRPLMNFWAAFSPSNESGVGTGGKALDTPFGLYRDGTELRAVYSNNTAAVRAACSSMGRKCDYPVVLGNSPLYGGLGGNPTIITASRANGALVLRHELGHSIIDVGEEYDGGFAYFGVNAQQNTSVPISWSHWLTDPSSSATHEEKEPRVERSVMPLQEYAWTLLNTSTPWVTTFDSAGIYSRFVVKFSLSGLPSKSDLTVKLDGEDLGWVPRQDIGVDRWHYEVHRDQSLDAGAHKIQFILNNAETEGEAQLCSVEVLEFGSEEEFISTPGYYGLFPTFSETNETTYRPTNEDCLMRMVTTPDFCSVCKEDLWRRLLRGISIIDEITEECSSSGTVLLSAKIVPLAQLRLPDNQVDTKEELSIVWLKDGEVVDKFTNLTEVDVGNGGDAKRTWTVRVAFTTEEVRQDPDDLLSGSLDYTVSSAPCSQG